MTRIAKQQERRSRSPRKNKAPSVKTGSKKDHLPKGYKLHANATTEVGVFIGKVRSCHVSS